MRAQAQDFGVHTPRVVRAERAFSSQRAKPVVPVSLEFVAGGYTPPHGERLDAAWGRSCERDGFAWGYVLCTRAPGSADFARWRDAGIEIDRAHGDPRVQVARIPRAALTTLEGDALVQWVGAARAWQKVDPALGILQARDELRAAHRPLWVTVFPSALGPQSRRRVLFDDIASTGAPHRKRAASVSRASHEAVRTWDPRDACATAFEALGARVLGYEDRVRVFRLAVPQRRFESTVQALAALDFVRYVEPVRGPTADGDRAFRQTGADALRGLAIADGGSVVLGILDTGARIASTVGGHADLGKFAAGFSFVPNGDAFKDPVGHGTHVLGVICGEGRGDTRYLGLAPAIGLDSMHRVFVGELFGTSDPIESRVLTAVTRFGTALTSGQRAPDLVQAAWGVGAVVSGGYVGSDAVSRAIDEQIWALGQAWVVSAGNDGGSSFSSEVISSLRAPAVAKNVLTVANLTDHRSTATGNAYECGRVHWTSGKGPTKDGRIKPELAAPGHFLRSCKAGTTDGYEDRGGTSQASAHVTGVLAGLIDHYPLLRGRPALQKALLVATSDPWRGVRSTNSASESWLMRQGFGCLDAYRAHFQRPSDPLGYATGVAWGTLTDQDAGAQFEVTIPSDAARVFFALDFIEPAASPGAKTAALADLDLWIDVEPFTTGLATGEYSSTRRQDVWDFFESDATSLAALRGKRVRIKIANHTRPGPSKDAHWGLAYRLDRGTPEPTSTLRVIAPLAVQPNQSFQVTAIVQPPSMSQSHVELTLGSAAGLQLKGLEHWLNDGTRLTYPKLASPTDRLDSWTIGSARWWEPFWRNRLIWTLQSGATPGVVPWQIDFASDDRTPRLEAFKRNLCVDGAAPADVVNLRSPTHSVTGWSAIERVELRWDVLTDVGCAGISGLAFSQTEGAPGVPSQQNVSGALVQYATVVPSTKLGFYFNLRAVDAAGNLSKTTTSIGPIRVDLDPPIVTKLDLNGGQSATRVPAFPVRVDAQDVHCQVKDMRWSGDASTWTAWVPYTSTSQTIDFSTLGWGSKTGERPVHCEVRDLADNVVRASGKVAWYRAPTITLSAPSSLPTVGHGHFTLTGTDLGDVDRIAFGAQEIVSNNARDWLDGYFEILGPTSLRVFPPQGLAPATYDVVLKNPAGPGPKIQLVLDAPKTPTLAVPPRRFETDDITILSHLGKQPAGSFDLLTISLSPRPLRVRGIVDLEHGGGTTSTLDPSFFLLSKGNPHDPTTGVARWKLPLGITAKIWFEAILIDPANPGKLPWPTTNADVCDVTTR